METPECMHRPFNIGFLRNNILSRKESVKVPHPRIYCYHPRRKNGGVIGGRVCIPLILLEYLQHLVLYGYLLDFEPVE